MSGNHGTVNIEKASEDKTIFTLHAQDELAKPANEVYEWLASLRKCQIAKASQEVPSLEVYQKTLRLVSLLWENYRQRIIQAEELKELATSQKLREISATGQEHTMDTRDSL